MRTVSRLAIATAVLGGGLLIAGPAAAVGACDEYDANKECPAGGEVQPVSSGGGTTTTAGGGGGATSLPFTGGEVTMVALAGTAAVGGGLALTAAGRKRKTV